MTEMVLKNSNVTWYIWFCKEWNRTRMNILARIDLERKARMEREGQA